tara:strand:+ start:115 stop:465 length:351 start_codon:yes stop_codon:yes gene_type:complete
MPKSIFFKKIENTSTIASTTIWQPLETQITENELYKYAPFNHLTVHNLSDADVEVRTQGTQEGDKGVELLPAGGTAIWDKDDNLSFYRPAIYHRGSPVATTIAANKIIVIIRKVVD